MLYSIFLTLAVVAGLLLLSALGFYLWCRTLPKEHRVERSARVDAPIEEVWDRIRDYGAQPDWRDGVEEVTREGTDDEDRDIWWETHAAGERIALATASEDPPHRLERAIVADAAFDGTWLFELEEIDESTTRVDMVETGSIDNPVLRFAARSVLGLDKFVEAYLMDLVEVEGGELDFEPNLDREELKESRSRDTGPAADMPDPVSPASKSGAHATASSPQDSASQESAPVDSKDEARNPDGESTEPRENRESSNG